MNNKMKFSLGALVLMVVMSALPASGLAQQSTDPSQVTIPSLDLDQAEVRDAIRALFKGLDVSYTISSDVQGFVTLQMRGKPFETVLQAILRQVDATYRVEGSTYTIIKRPQQTIFSGEQTPGITGSNKVYLTIPIRHADPQVIFRLLQGQKNINSLASLVSMEGEITQGIRGGGFGGVGGGNTGGGFQGGGNLGGGGSIGGQGGGRGASGGGGGSAGG